MDLDLNIKNQSRRLLRLIRLLIGRYEKDSVSAMAAKLTLFLMLSIFPFLIVALEIIRFYDFSYAHLLDLQGVLPPSIYNYFYSVVDDMNGSSNGNLLPVAIIIAIWSSSKGVATLIQSLNKAYRTNIRRKYIITRIIAFFYTIGFLLILILTGILIVFGNQIYQILADLIHLPHAFGHIAGILRYLVSTIMYLAFFTGLYNLSHISTNRIKHTLPGTVLAILGLTISSVVFSLYIKYSTSLSFLYGNLTNIIILLLWLYIVSNVIIMGGELNAVLWEWHLKRNGENEQ